MLKSEKASREPGSLFYSRPIMKTLLILLFPGMLFAACGEKTGETRADIIQRKEMPGDKLLVGYRFWVGDKMYADSTILQNQVVSDDSSLVIFSVPDPSRNHLKLP